MATPATTSNPPSPPEPPAVPVDPGIIAGTHVLGFVALNPDDASIRRLLQQIRENTPAIGWSDLVLLKLLVSQESQDIIVSHLGNDMLQAMVQELLTNVRTRA